jgi:hypothetical protein
MIVRKMALVLVLALAVGAGTATIHHHEGAQDHGHCVACLLLASCLAALPALLVLVVPLARCGRLIPPSPRPYLPRRLNPCAQRAPPVW